MLAEATEDLKPRIKESVCKVYGVKKRRLRIVLEKIRNFRRARKTEVVSMERKKQSLRSGRK